MTTDRRTLPSATTPAEGIEIQLDLFLRPADGGELLCKVGGEHLAQLSPQPLGDAIRVSEWEIEPGDVPVPSHQHRLVATEQLGRVGADLADACNLHGTGKRDARSRPASTVVYTPRAGGTSAAGWSPLRRPSGSAVRAAGGLRPRAVGEPEIAGVDQQAGALAEDEDGVSLVDGVAQEGRAAGDAQVPEGAGDDAGFPPLRRDPLDEEATGEEELSEQSEADPIAVWLQTW